MVQSEPDIVYAYRSIDCPEHGDNVTSRRPRSDAQTPWVCVQCDQPQPGPESEPELPDLVTRLLPAISEFVLSVELASHGMGVKPKPRSGQADFDDVSNRTMVVLRAYAERFSRVHPTVADAIKEAWLKYYNAQAAQTAPKKDR